MSETLPIAIVLSVTHGQSERIVHISCPLCGRKHTHGLPYGVTPEEHVNTRVRHCGGPERRRQSKNGPTQYKLLYPSGLGTEGVTHP